MLLNIYSLQKPVLRKEVTAITMKTTNGEITILDNHRPLITPLAEGLIRIKTSEGTEEIENSGGFVEVRPKGQVNILVEN